MGRQKSSDIQHLESGTYLLKVYSKGQQLTKRISSELIGHIYISAVKISIVLF